MPWYRQLFNQTEHPTDGVCPSLSSSLIMFHRSSGELISSVPWSTAASGRWRMDSMTFDDKTQGIDGVKVTSGAKQRRHPWFKHTAWIFILHGQNLSVNTCQNLGISIPVACAYI